MNTPYQPKAVLKARIESLEALNAELLAVLKEATQAGEGWQDDSWGRTDDSAFIKARRVIAKAEEKTP